MSGHSSDCSSLAFSRSWEDFFPLPGECWEGWGELCTVTLLLISMGREPLGIKALLWAGSPLQASPSRTGWLRVLLKWHLSHRRHSREMGKPSLPGEHIQGLFCSPCHRVASGCCCPMVKFSMEFLVHGWEGFRSKCACMGWVVSADRRSQSGWGNVHSSK